MKIGVFETEIWERSNLEKSLKGKDFKLFSAKLSPKNTKKASDFEIISIFIGSKITEPILSKLSKLKFIATRSTGFDHIDLSECKKRGIKVANVPFYGENTVAEHTFGLILTLSRKINKCYERTGRIDFDLHGLTGFDLKGKTLGIVGMGHIGQFVAKIALGFGMKLIAFDVVKDSELAKKLRFRYVSFDYLLANSDIITLHAPYNKHTHHMINKRNIKGIKKGAYLINTARGGLVETGALLWALDKGIIAGAGLDVLEEEEAIKEESQLLSTGERPKFDMLTLLQEHELIKRDNVIITPHNAFNSKEAIDRIIETTAENIDAFMSGKPKNLIKATK